MAELRSSGSTVSTEQLNRLSGSSPFPSNHQQLFSSGAPATLEVLEEDLRALNLWSIKQTSLVFIKVYVLLVSTVASPYSPCFLIFHSPGGPLLSLFSSLIDIQTHPHSQLA